MTTPLDRRGFAWPLLFVAALACSNPGSRITVVRPLMAPGAAACVSGTLRNNPSFTRFASSEWRDNSGLTWRGGVRAPAPYADTGAVLAVFTWKGTRSQATVEAAARELRTRVSSLSARCRLPQAPASCEYEIDGHRRSCSTSRLASNR